MVAEELALNLAAEYICPGQVIADPFCGSGRLLVAACDLPGERIGFDVNPLACLLSNAKFAEANPDALRRIVKAVPEHHLRERSVALLPVPTHRKVDWFSQDALHDLSCIVSWLNALSLDRDERLVVAAVPSAVTRDVSFARKTGWKLHRMSASEREAWAGGGAWSLLTRRLTACASALERAPPVRCTSTIMRSDCTDPEVIDPYQGRCDVVLTSPPYGDSKSTVQYGAASEICLTVVQHLDGFGDYAMQGSRIERDCLGGDPKETEEVRLPMFWAGKRGSREAAASARFLTALSRACASVDRLLKPGGAAVFIVARRSTGGFRLKIDDFLNDEMSGHGLELERLRHRTLKWKRAPHYINRFARSASVEKRAMGVLPTMKDEIILSFRKPPEIIDARITGQKRPNSNCHSGFVNGAPQCQEGSVPALD